jgi:hypothetical protein
MAPKKKQSMIITTSGKRPIRDVVRDLKAAGFDVEQTLEAINIVTGSAPADAKKALRSVKDVVDVSEDHPIDIGPPGSEVS